MLGVLDFVEQCDCVFGFLQSHPHLFLDGLGSFAVAVQSGRHRKHVLRVVSPYVVGLGLDLARTLHLRRQRAQLLELFLAKTLLNAHRPPLLTLKTISRRPLLLFFVLLLSLDELAD